MCPKLYQTSLTIIQWGDMRMAWNWRLGHSLPLLWWASFFLVSLLEYQFSESCNLFCFVFQFSNHLPSLSSCLVSHCIACIKFLYYCKMKMNYTWLKSARLLFAPHCELCMHRVLWTVPQNHKIHINVLHFLFKLCLTTILFFVYKGPHSRTEL